MKPKGIIIHHSATIDGRTFSWQAIRKYHTSYRIDGEIVTKTEFNKRLRRKEGRRFEKPWGDIGYHAGLELINEHYEILLGRSIFEKGAHCKGYNNYIGFCYIGNWDIKEPERDRILYGIDRFIVPVMILFKFSIDNIYYHRDFNHYKTCPGILFPSEDKFKQMVYWRRQMLKLQVFKNKWRQI